MDRPYIPDMLAFLQAAEKWVGDELDLAQLEKGDRLLVRTRNTSYLFVMTGEHTALLSSDRLDRPSGPVQIQGCVFGRSRMIKPGHLFCGGGLEIAFDGGRQIFTTTSIETIQMIKMTPPAGDAPPADAPSPASV
jgi:hypothetical protein